MFQREQSQDTTQAVLQQASNDAAAQGLGEYFILVSVENSIRIADNEDDLRNLLQQGGTYAGVSALGKAG